MVRHGDRFTSFMKLCFTGTPCFMTVERMGVYEFIAMVTPTTVKFIFRAPTLSFVTNIYYLPFQANVWFSLVALVIISCFVIYITFRVSNVRSPPIEALRPSDIFLFGISSICQMGVHREPKYLSGKISTVIMYIMTSTIHIFLHHRKYFSDFFHCCSDFRLHLLHSQHCITASIYN